MNERFSFWLFILLIPAFMALGHDAYIAFGSTPEKIAALKRFDLSNARFVLSDLGYIWGTYATASLEFIRDILPTNVWEDFLTPLLQQKSVVIGLIPASTYFIFNIVKFITHKVNIGRAKRVAAGSKPTYKRR